MPTLLSDTNLFLWVDLENSTPEENKFILEDIFHFHPLSIEDCVMVSRSPKVEEYAPKEGDRFTDSDGTEYSVVGAMEFKNTLVMNVTVYVMAANVRTV